MKTGKTVSILLVLFCSLLFVFVVSSSEGVDENNPLKNESTHEEGDQQFVYCEVNGNGLTQCSTKIEEHGKETEGNTKIHLRQRLFKRLLDEKTGGDLDAFWKELRPLLEDQNHLTASTRWSSVKTAFERDYSRPFSLRRYKILEGGEADDEQEGNKDEEDEEEVMLRGTKRNCYAPINPEEEGREMAGVEGGEIRKGASSLNYRRVHCPRGKRLLDAILEERGIKQIARKPTSSAPPSSEDSSVELIWAKITLPTIRTSDAAAGRFKSLLEHQRINRVPRATEINRKDSLAARLLGMQTLFPGDEFGFHPVTFELPRDEEKVKQVAQEEPGLHWIAKPTFGGQGAGIHLSTNVTDLIFRAKSTSNLGNYVLQKYIRNPLLINGFKFTMRLYVAISSIDPLRIYLYDDGIAKFTTMPYSNSSEFFDDEFMLMHITNQALNKGEKAFVFSEDPEVDNIGSRWSIKAMRAHLRKEKGREADLLLWSRVKDALVKTIASIANESLQVTKELFTSPSSQIGVSSRRISNCCFQLFGVDVDVDSDLNPWLIEANVNPTLGGSKAAFDNVQKERLLRDFFDMVGIVKFDRENYLQQISKRIPSIIGSSTFKAGQEGKEEEEEEEEEEDTETQRALSTLIYEILHSGGFEMIFPAPETMTNYNQMMPHTPLNSVTQFLLNTLK